jgi:Uma2 family endonuclease
MATVTDLEIDDLEAEERKARIVEPRKHFEVVDGQIVEEPPLGAQEGLIASILDQTMGYHARNHRLGRVVTEVLFVLEADQRLRRRPDVAFVSSERWPLDRKVLRDAAWDVIPDIAVEITSPTDLIDDLMDKLGEYFKVGVRLVWIVYPKQNQVYLYNDPTHVRILQLGDELDGGDVLPGFRISLGLLFESERDEPTPEA